MSQFLLLIGSGSGTGIGIIIAIANAVLVEDAGFADVIANCVPSGAVPLVTAPFHAASVEPAAPAIKAEALVGPVGHDVPNRLDGPAAVDPTLGDPAAFGPAAETL